MQERIWRRTKEASDLSSFSYIKFSSFSAGVPN